MSVWVAWIAIATRRCPWRLRILAVADTFDEAKARLDESRLEVERTPKVSIVSSGVSKQTLLSELVEVATEPTTPTVSSSF